MDGNLGFVLMIVSVISTAVPCPVSPPCFCNEMTRVISCSHRNLTEIPQITPSATLYTRLTLNGNFLSHIPPDAFNGLRVSQIQIRQNSQLTLIRSGAFRSLPDLQDLILDMNNISTLETQAFKDLPELRRLWLSGNRIESLKNATLANLPSLVDLSLDRNAITNFEKRAVANATNILRFDVSTNQLTSLDFSLICGWKALHILNLSHNPLVCDCSLSWVQLWREGHVADSNVPREVIGTCRDRVNGGEAGLYVHIFQDCHVSTRFGDCESGGLNHLVG